MPMQFPIACATFSRRRQMMYSSRDLLEHFCSRDKVCPFKTGSFPLFKLGLAGD